MHRLLSRILSRELVGVALWAGLMASCNGLIFGGWCRVTACTQDRKTCRAVTGGKICWASREPQRKKGAFTVAGRRFVLGTPVAPSPPACTQSGRLSGSGLYRLMTVSSSSKSVIVRSERAEQT